MFDASRRQLLRSTGVAMGAGILAGCLGGDADDDDDVLGDPEYVEGRPEPGGTPMEELPELSGELTIYSGRSQTRIGELMDYLEAEYDDLSLEVRYDDTADLIATIETEAETPADVFYGSETQSMTHLKAEGYTVSLPDDVLELSQPDTQDPDGYWAGFTRRFRAIAYHTGAYDRDELPDDIFAYASDERFRDDIMWAPDQGSFQAFVTAMRVYHGEEDTRSWLRAMVDEQRVETSPGGDSAIAQATADGEIGIGITNHYILRDNPGDTLELAYTSGDAGAMFNVTGAAVMADGNEELAANFVAHLLSAEAQEYFATTTWEYPTIDGVEPIDELQSTDEFEPPELDLNELADLEPTLELLREEEIL